MPNRPFSKYMVSLFSGAGIGDVGFRRAGLRHLVLAELEEDRSALAALNFPEAIVAVGDIRVTKDIVVESAESRLKDSGGEMFLVSCTAPCQGMSKNGRGSLLKAVREGKRPAMDARNRLILSGLEVVKSLRPRWVVFENVTEMRNTVIETDSGMVATVLDTVFDALTPDYAGRAYDIEFADYGVPQRRRRLITVLTRDERAKRLFSAGTDFVPPPTHCRISTEGLMRWVSVAEAVAEFPPLDASSEKLARSPIPFHHVPVLEAKKYEWVRHTPFGKSAFDNQCVSPECRYEGNATHGASHDEEGVNRAHRDTPLYCWKCSSLLPRPYVEDSSLPRGKRIMSGYTSAYKRMDADLPAPTLTRNLSYPCSDQKIHPSQNRVLSLAEAMTLHTMNRYQYRWGPISYRSGKGEKRAAVAHDGLVRLVIGESVPPLFFEVLGRHLISLSSPGQLRPL